MATAKAVKGTKENPKLLTRAMGKDGEKQALYLEYYLGRTETPKLNADGTPMYYTDGKMAGKPIYAVKHIRKYEKIEGLWLWSKPGRDATKKTWNDNTLQTARAIRDEREQQFNRDRYGYAVNLHRGPDFVTYFREYIDGYDKADKRNVQLALNRFESFLQEKHNGYIAGSKVVTDAKGEDKTIYQYNFKPNNLTPAVLREFIAYIEEKSEYSGAGTIWARFKKVCNQAIKDNILKTDPFVELTAKEQPSKSGAKEKTALTAEQVLALFNTHYQGENPEIRRAFLFCCFAGLRFCDVKELRFNNINYKTCLLSFEQSKTKHSTTAENYRVEIPCTDTMMALLGSPEDYGKKADGYVFDLPSHTMCLKALKHWAKRAGIEEKVTWHCGRVSCATMLLDGNTDIATIQRILGHSSLSYITTYAKSRADRKRQALEASMPKLNLNTESK